MGDIYRLIEVQFLQKYDAVGKSLGWPELWVSVSVTQGNSIRSVRFAQ